LSARSFRFVVLGGLFAAASVAAGAFGAHALKSILDPSMLAVYETAARYQLYHALGLFVVAWLVRETDDSLAVKAGWLFCIGILLFSGSLYIVALAGIKWMGGIDSPRRYLLYFRMGLCGLDRLACGTCSVMLATG
jgi:uncharacterized membrane protein YgdD (TMEM256/DUF423 family)